MSWLQKLYDTYDNCAEVLKSNREIVDAPMLAPVGQMVQSVQVELTLDTGGKIIDARVIEEREEQNTFIPCTEDSQNRTSGACAHVLFDKLKYMAGDYYDYLWLKSNEEPSDKLRKKNEESRQEFHEARTLYMQRLNELAARCDGIVKKHLDVIVTYLKRNTLVSDLIARNILRGSIPEHIVAVQVPRKEIVKYPLYNRKIVPDVSEAFVRIRVHYPGEVRDKIWEVPAFWQSYKEYYLEKLEAERGTDLCYVQGWEIVPGLKHLCRIPFTNSKSKLISSNDSENFTYRGRFATSKQAMCVGYETSQKAFNALRWLVQKQSWHEKGQIYVIWGTKNQRIPAFDDDSADLLTEDPTDNSTFDGDINTREGFAKRLILVMQGYKKELDGASQVVVLGLNSATDGRLAVTYYQEVSGSDFLNRIENWHNTCQWLHTYKRDKKGEKKMHAFFGAPAPLDIIKAAYQISPADPRPKPQHPIPDHLLHATMDRLIPCILESRPLPGDLVKTLFRRASNPAAVKEDLDREMIMTITCALVRKYYNDRGQKEEITVALQPDYPDRSYQFGRLLAYAENIEGYVNKLDGENRQTNAERLMHQFSKRPMKTWQILESQLQPYTGKLQSSRSGLKARLMAEINEIVSGLSEWTDDLDKPLTELFILGYRCQLEKLQKDMKAAAEAKAQKEREKRAAEQQDSEE